MSARSFRERQNLGTPASALSSDEAVAASAVSNVAGARLVLTAEPLWASSSDLDTCRSIMLESFCASRRQGRENWPGN